MWKIVDKKLKGFQMNKIMKTFLSLILITSFFFISCEKDECGDCGPGVKGGYFFKRVTEEDLATLGEIPDIELDECITYNVVDIASEEIDIETVDIVDDCCCD